MEAHKPGKLNITEVVASFSGRLAGFIKKRVRRSEDAEDILQEVFFQLTEADRLMKPIDQMASWLFTVARNHITDLYRKKKPELLSDYEDEDEEFVMEELGQLLASDSETPETAYLRSLIWEELYKALEELSPEQKQVFEMTELQGMSFKQIAEQTGVSVNTLISRKRYAVLHLRERLKTLYDELLNL